MNKIRGHDAWPRELRQRYMLLSALARPVAFASGIIAIAGFGEFTIGSDASLGVHAPEKAVIGRGHGVVVFGENELALPAQSAAKRFATYVEAFGIGHAHHRAPPLAALRIARLTAAFATVIL